MKEINWSIFDAKFYNKKQSAFERLAYYLFCSCFNIENGILAYKNQIGIETEPFDLNGRLIGFQAKYISPSAPLSSKKKDIIKSLKLAKEKNNNLDEVYLYLNKAPSESKNKGKKKPQYILDIEGSSKELNLIINWQFPSQIEKQLSLSKNIQIAQEFFPDFHDLLKQRALSQNSNEQLNIIKTAIIQLEIEKIRESYYEHEWDGGAKELSKLNRFSNHTNETIATSVFDFIDNVSDQTRANMPESIAGSILSSILTFFPSSYDSEEEERIENGKRCINIGFNLAYDALIHINKLRIAEYGLTIWKFIYRYGKRRKIQELVSAVFDQYKELETTLERPERDDLEYAKQLVKIFKKDLDTQGLAFPRLPLGLHQEIESKRDS